MPVSVQEAFGLWPEGNQSVEAKPHLKFSSVASWFKAEGLPNSLSKICDVADRDRRIHELGELERFLFAKHLASLPVEAQEAYRAGEHASQSHKKSELAEPI